MAMIDYFLLLFQLVWWTVYQIKPTGAPNWLNMQSEACLSQKCLKPCSKLLFWAKFRALNFFCSWNPLCCLTLVFVYHSKRRPQWYTWFQGTHSVYRGCVHSLIEVLFSVGQSVPIVISLSVASSSSPSGVCALGAAWPVLWWLWRTQELWRAVGWWACWRPLWWGRLASGRYPSSRMDASRWDKWSVHRCMYRFWICFKGAMCCILTRVYLHLKMTVVLATKFGTFDKWVVINSCMRQEVLW